VANCHPCLDRHLAKRNELENPREKVVEAVKVRLMLIHGAERSRRRKVRKLLGESMDVAA